MRSIEVKAEVRALRANWTRKLATDLHSYHGLDIESEFARILKEELLKERVSKRKKSINKIFQN